METIRIDRRPDRIAVITLARPQVHNAFNQTLIGEMTATLRELAQDEAVRAILLRGEGRSFSAGADLVWMQQAADQVPADNIEDAEKLAQLMHVLDTLPKPTVAMVHGAAMGGAVGLVACCDIALAAETASFALSEVRLGLIPAVVSPYVLAATGPHWARRWMLTGERFDAAEAFRCGLVHQVVPDDQLEAATEKLLARLIEAAPSAQAAAKELIRAVCGEATDVGRQARTARRIAELRAGPEAREGMAAFLAKRPPAWRG